MEQPTIIDNIWQTTIPSFPKSIATAISIATSMAIQQPAISILYTAKLVELHS